MKIAILMILLFVNGSPATGRFFLLESLEVCEAELAKLKAEAKEKGVDVWASCVEVDRSKSSAKPLGDPKTTRKS